MKQTLSKEADSFMLKHFTKSEKYNHTKPMSEMTVEERKRYDYEKTRNYMKSSPLGRYCLCGNSAIKFKFGGWVCYRCNELETGLHKGQQ